MKHFLSLLFILFTLAGYSQQETPAPTPTVKKAWKSSYKQHTTTATLSVGFVDGYRQDYTLPVGFKKSNTSGFAPVYGKLEYAFFKHVSVAATIGYDAFVYNFKQEYTGNSGAFTRYKTNNTRIFSGGVTGFYHLDKYIHVNNFDPFIGIGLALNNIRYQAFPQGDSTLTKIDHTVTPYIKAGARYYITDKFNLFGDIGYDKQSIFSIGVSCRFHCKKTKPTTGK
jgi:hypothetical protein